MGERGPLHRFKLWGKEYGIPYASGIYFADDARRVHLGNFPWRVNDRFTCKPVAQFMFTLLAEFARLERETLRERKVSGMDEARRQGVTLGRPVGATEEKAVFLKKYAAVARQLRAGLSVRKTAKLCEVAINTVRKVKTLL